MPQPAPDGANRAAITICVILATLMQLGLRHTFRIRRNVSEIDFFTSSRQDDYLHIHGS
jgi:hypothetical protein